MKMLRPASVAGLSTHSNNASRQVAAFCVRSKKGTRQVLLITSSENRWIFPKGWPMDGKTDAEAAEIEAWEEAGVKAKSVSDAPVTRVQSTKDRGNGESEPLLLDIYQIEVETLKKVYPEASKRARRWVDLCDAVDEVDDPALSDFLKAL